MSLLNPVFTTSCCTAAATPLAKHDKIRYGRSVKCSYFLRSAARSLQSYKVRLHRLILVENRKRFAQDLGSTAVFRRHDLIVHPFAFAPGRNDARATQIGKVARYFWLALFKDFYEIADTYFLAIHQV